VSTQLQWEAAFRRPGLENPKGPRRSAAIRGAGYVLANDFECGEPLRGERRTPGAGTPRRIAAMVSAALDSRTMAHSRKPPSSSAVAIERDGKAHSGTFYVDGRLLTVL
jgi:hypothetical protein